MEISLEQYNKMAERLTELEYLLADWQWIPCSERLPEENTPVNVTWINHNPVEYYGDIKDIPFTATAVYFRNNWYWYSVDIEDVLAEYGSREYVTRALKELLDKDIEIIAWMPLPEPYGGEQE